MGALALQLIYLLCRPAVISHTHRTTLSARTIEAIQADSENPSPATKALVQELFMRDAADDARKRRVIRRVLFVSVVLLDIIAIYLFWNDKRKATS